MTRTWFEEQLQNKVALGGKRERERIIKLLEDNDHYSIDWLIELINGDSE